MNSINWTDIEKWKAMNNTNDFSTVDYLCSSMQKYGNHADILIGFADLFWPDFIDIDGMILLEFQYSQNKINELKSKGMKKSEIEFWCNLVCVDGLFENMNGISIDHMELVASRLVKAWSSKLLADYPEIKFEVRKLYDHDVGDICVVFTRVE